MSIQIPVAVDVTLVLRDAQQHDDETENQRERHDYQRDDDVVQKALEQEHEVPPREDPFPVGRIEEVTHRLPLDREARFEPSHDDGRRDRE